MEATASVIVKSLDEPEASRSPSERGRIELVSLGDVTVGRAVFQPGWRWTVDVQPAAGTELCAVAHTGYVLSGHQVVRMADGTEVELRPGDAFVIPAGHDAWVVGDEPCVTIDFTPSAATGHAGRCPCGVEFRVASAAGLDHLVAAIQQHAAGSHGHQLSRDEVLDGVSGGRD